MTRDELTKPSANAGGQDLKTMMSVLYDFMDASLISI